LHDQQLELEIPVTEMVQPAQNLAHFLLRLVYLGKIGYDIWRQIQSDKHFKPAVYHRQVSIHGLKGI
jgi:hypothetical protein